MGKRSKIKTVLDTNVIISILLWKGQTRRILDLVDDNKIVIITSDKIISELRRIIFYPKFQTLITKSGLSAEQLVQRYLSVAKLIKDPHFLAIIKKDPSDNIILSCALSAKADFIVSGDKHVLELKIFNGIPILSPRQFLNKFDL